MRRLLWILFLAISACGCQRRELPVLATIPEFRLQTQDGKDFTQAEMKGKFWVADFIFTSCGGACPLMTERMKKNIQAPLEEMAAQGGEIPARIVSFSVDPERDTPARLAEYAKDHGANLKHWLFLTGPLDEVTKTVVQGFKISMGKVPLETPSGKPGEGPSEADIFEVVHGEQFLLIDDQGRIRGYYSSEGSGLRKLMGDLRSLMKGKGS
ncbi:MAG: SCO family protein [bacterium]